MEKKPVPKWRMLIGIVDSAIEIIPESVFIKLINSKKKYHDKEEIKNLKRKPLLDSAIHHQWMTELKNHNKRGRPDIIHRTLLAIQDSPFISENQVDIVVETHNGILQARQTHIFCRTDKTDAGSGIFTCRSRM